ncbi:MAG: hypothetical protein AAGA64_03915 [Bacteroidota bacterium]
MNRIAIKVSLVFMVIYGLLVTVGSIFLVSWGHTNWYKEMMLFALSFPVAWKDLIVEESLIFLPLNILFWTAIIYGLVTVALKVKSIIAK